MKKLSSYIKEVLKKMCKFANIKFSEKMFFEEQWYLKHTWTREQELAFCGWLVDYWYNNKDAREEMTYCIKNKKKLEIAALGFVTNFGWKINYEKQK